MKVHCQTSQMIFIWSDYST